MASSSPPPPSPPAPASAPRNERLLVLYGSESGCAEDVAQRIERAARARGLCTALRCMDEFDVSTLPLQPQVVYVASTAGTGTCPANMRRFWRLLLRRSLPRDSLCRQRAAVFGLGDSSYPLFNAAARRLHQRLLDLGAAPLCPRGLADDQHPQGVDATLIPFMRQLFRALNCREQPHGEALPPPLFRVKLEAAPPKDECGTLPPPPPLGSFGHGAGEYTPFDADVVCNRRLSVPQHSQEVRHVEFDLSGSGIRFEPGDVLLLHPSNDADEVRRFVEDALGQSLDTIITIDPASSSSSSSSCLRLPRRTTLGDLCTRFLDIAGTPKRPFFEALAFFAADELHKQRLEEFCSADGADELYAYNNRERRTYAEVMMEFSSAKIPLQHLVELIPRLKPRQFSIASSPLAHPNRAHIVAAIVEFTTPYKRNRIGICSRFLRSLADRGAKAPIWTRAGSLRLPRDLHNTPMVMVGPGTGVAPFRSMLQHLQALRLRCDGNLPGAALFFGCRFEQRDFLYRDDWNAMVADGTLQLFAPAFSRDQPQKVYVQHRLVEHGEVVFDMVHRRNAVFMVAGNAKQMPEDVRQALLDILQRHGRMNEDESNAYLKQMTRNNRFLLECWA